MVQERLSVGTHTNKSAGGEAGVHVGRERERERNAPSTLTRSLMMARTRSRPRPSVPSVLPASPPPCNHPSKSPHPRSLKRTWYRSDLHRFAVSFSATWVGFLKLASQRTRVGYWAS